MTTKQIAEYLGKDERTVQRWVKSLGDKVSSVGDKVSSVGDKLSSSSPAKPADYTLDEACQIIEEGMGPDVAAVYRTNAVNAEMANKASTPKAPRLPNGIQMTALCRLYEKKALSAGQVQVLLGVASRVPEPVAVNPETVAPPEVAEAGFAALNSLVSYRPGLPPGAMEKANKVGYAAGMRSLNADIAKVEADKKQGKLLGSES